MLRTPVILLVIGLATLVQAGPDEEGKQATPAAKPVKKTRFRMALSRGRFTGSNSVTSTVKTTERQGDVESTSSAFVQRTERFIDNIVRVERAGDFELRRNYLHLYTKQRDSESGQPSVQRSPLQGREVIVRETRRRREVSLEDGSDPDAEVKRTVGMEIDWRDMLPEEPVGPGDEWKADVTRLARRLAAQLDCGSRTKMMVRYEEDVVVNGSRRAKFYVDWNLEGMRDRHLHTTVNLAGDVFFDFALRRVVVVDLAGSITVRGAYLDERKARIVKGHGSVTLTSSVSPAPVQAAAAGAEDADAEDAED